MHSFPRLLVLKQVCFCLEKRLFYFEIFFFDKMKIANVAELGKLPLEEISVPDGFAVPFHFYDCKKKKKCSSFSLSKLHNHTFAF